MIEIRPLSQFDPAALVALARGYTTAEMYRATWSESDGQIIFALTLEALPTPQPFRFPFAEEDLDRYATLVPNEYSYGAYEDEALVGIVLGEGMAWNRTVWVWELHVAEPQQRRGIGRRLLAAVAERAKAAGQRALVLETQNTNVSAIRFYRRVGCTIEGIDISYYTNEDTQPGNTVAVFMKLRLE